MTWEFIRITGLVALAFLTVSVALGVAGPALHRPTSRLASVSMHMTAAVGGTVLVIAHILFAIADSWITVPAMAAVVPGASPVGALVGGGRDDRLRPHARHGGHIGDAPAGTRLWKRAHVLAYPVWALVWVHTRDRIRRRHTADDRDRRRLRRPGGRRVRPAAHAAASRPVPTKELEYAR